jgi:uncharacterized short protein YbdD (DUF466 family)
VPDVSLALEAIGAALRAFLRGVAGRGYEEYLAHQASAHPSEAPLSRAAYQERELRRRYDGISRCC